MDKIKILAAVDNIEIANSIARTIASFIDKKKADVTLFNVIESYDDQEVFLRYPEKYIKYFSRKNRFDEIIEFFNKEKIRNQGVIFKHGSAEQCILDEQKAGDYDLVVIGSHNKKFMERFFVGSTSYKVLKQCTSSVLMVSSNCDFKIVEGDFEVLAPVDGSEFSKCALIKSSEFLDKNRAKLSVLNVKISMENVLPIDMYQYSDISEIIKESNNVASAIINDAAQIANYHELTVRNKYYMDGDAAHTILREIKNKPYNLILMASRGYSYLQSLFVGSVSTKVYEHSTIPVLIIKK